VFRRAPVRGAKRAENSCAPARVVAKSNDKNGVQGSRSYGDGTHTTQRLGEQLETVAVLELETNQILRPIIPYPTGRFLGGRFPMHFVPGSGVWTFGEGHSGGFMPRRWLQSSPRRMAFVPEGQADRSQARSAWGLFGFWAGPSGRHDRR
jgi:hypothetical protein